MEAGTVTWGHGRLRVTLHWDEDTPVWAGRLTPAAPQDARPGPPPSAARRPQPFVELIESADGGGRTPRRLVDTVAGRRLRYRSHRELPADAGWVALEVVQVDPRTGLRVTTVLRSSLDVPALTAAVTVANDGENAVRLEGVAVAVLIGAPAPDPVDDLDVVHANNDWLAENRWERCALRDAGLVNLLPAAQPADPKGSFRRVSTGSWSTGTSTPAGVLINRRTQDSVAWQIETNGAWRWEVGERHDGAYLALSGPTQLDHSWSKLLRPGESFDAVPVTVGAALGSGLEGAAAALTAYRRAARRSHPDNAARPVVFNDYMNTVMGNPTTEKLLPLIDAASSVGAEIFVIDAGWYDDGGEWWNSVGEWLPSTTRFPGGIGEVLDRIRAVGMRPGLWLEPEVIGERSPLAERLPDAAFLQRDGVRVREQARYHLDLRHPAARAHLDATVDRLVGEYGVGYLKLDYNIDPGAGTDLDADSVGDGLLAHNRAHLDWLDGVLSRHPDLVLENCASGGMRADFAMLSRLHLQSTSDQQDVGGYAPIAASAAMSMLPEQAANWAFPQPGMDREEAVFTLVTSMLGRFYLSGHLDRMSVSERDLVAEAVQVHQGIRAGLGAMFPIWPLGLPSWTAPWVASGMADEQSVLLSLWRRTGAQQELEVALPRFAGSDVHIEAVFPRKAAPWIFAWDPDAGMLHVRADGAAVAARTVRLVRQ